MRKLDDHPQRVHLRVLPQAGVVGRDAAVGEDGRGLDHCESGPAHEYPPEVREVPVGEVSVLSRVLAHGGDLDANRRGDDC